MPHPPRPEPRPPAYPDTFVTLLRQALDGFVPPDLGRLLDRWEVRQ